MSQHYLLDGYNIIKQTPSLSRGTLETQREALLQWLNVHRPQGSVNNSITIVFDGKEDVYGPLSEGMTKVVFSKGQSADDVIKKMVEGYSLKTSLVVVSNDKDIKLYVRALGAKVLSVKDFIGSTVKKSKPSSTDQSESKNSKYISLTQQDKINKELEKIWIKK